MVNYSNGKIYKIEPLNGEEGDIYIGSTTKEYLSQRMDKHRKDFKMLEKGTSKSIYTSFKLFEKYGVQNCNIILLELVNANSKDELHSREAHYIKTLKCVNKVIPLQTQNEYEEKNKTKIKEYKKDYYKINKEELTIKNKEYCENNKEHLVIKKKEYCENNKELIAIKNKEWREKNKEQIAINKKEYYNANKAKINARSKELRTLKKLQLTN